MIAWRWTNPTLAAICILLALALQWPDPREQASPLTTLSAEDINSVTLFQGAELRLDFLRDNEGWMLTHPDVGRAHSARVETLLGLLAAPSRRRLHGEETQLAAFGLAPTPKAGARFNDTRIDLGISVPGEDLVYAHVDGEVHLIDSLYLSLLGLPASHFLADD